LHRLYLFGLDDPSEDAQRAIAPVHETAARWEYDENRRIWEGEVRRVHQRSRLQRIAGRLLTSHSRTGEWAQPSGRRGRGRREGAIQVQGGGTER
jgi:hypothetical protein